MRVLEVLDLPVSDSGQIVHVDSRMMSSSLFGFRPGKILLLSRQVVALELKVFDEVGHNEGIDEAGVRRPVLRS